MCKRADTAGFLNRTTEQLLQLLEIMTTSTLIMCKL